MSKHGTPKKPRPRPNPKFFILLILFLTGCANPISPEQCSKIFEEAADLTMVIADVSTTDKDKLVYVQRATIIMDLAGTLGCPIVIPMLEK